MFLLNLPFITARQRSCGKVMFSVVRVCHSICPQGMPVHGPAHLCVGSWFRSHYKALPLCKGPSVPVHVKTCSVCSPYCRQASGWHSTEMPSCLVQFWLPRHSKLLWWLISLFQWIEWGHASLCLDPTLYRWYKKFKKTNLGACSIIVRKAPDIANPVKPTHRLRTATASSTCPQPMKPSPHPTEAAPIKPVYPNQVT